MVLIATPTDYDSETDNFDTSSIEEITGHLVKCFGSSNQRPIFLIKSTVPVGYVQSLRLRYEGFQIVFMPEFLREGSAMKDNFEPSRIVVGDRGEIGQLIAELYGGLVLNQPEVLLTGSNEAEAIKLFSNTFLAMRVGFFNELDTYAQAKMLDAQEVITGISLDPRIGGGYNNPSFGYGGYCLPKDTKQLKSNFADVPHALITGVVETNRIRMDYVAETILARARKLRASTIGFYRLVMKQGSDNFRSSSVIEVLQRLVKSDYKLVIYEPLLESNTFEGIALVSDFDVFAEQSDLIVTNRYNSQLDKYSDRVFTRDIFHQN
jgi:UDPglucose 6-dehydrogenase